MRARRRDTSCLPVEPRLLNRSTGTDARTEQSTTANATRTAGFQVPVCPVGRTSDADAIGYRMHSRIMSSQQDWTSGTTRNRGDSPADHLLSEPAMTGAQTSDTRKQASAAKEPVVQQHRTPTVQRNAHETRKSCTHVVTMAESVLSVVENVLVLWMMRVLGKWLSSSSLPQLGLLGFDATPASLFRKKICCYARCQA